MSKFDLSSYNDQLQEVNRKQQEIAAAKAAHEAERKQLAEARASVKAKAQEVLNLRKAVDLRMEEKKNREIRTESLRQAGILLPDEEISKVPKPRAKKR